MAIVFRLAVIPFGSALSATQFLENGENGNIHQKWDSINDYGLMSCKNERHLIFSPFQDEPTLNNSPWATSNARIMTLIGSAAPQPLLSSAWDRP